MACDVESAPRDGRSLSDDKVGRLALGTVQFGLDYGVANEAGQVAEDEVRAIMSLAERSGVTLLDTAHVYGNSEETIGRCLAEDSTIEIVTKTARCAGQDSSGTNTLRDAFALSLDRLRRDRVYGLLLHDADDLLGEGGEQLVDWMQRLQATGRAERIGVSIYDAHQLDQVLRMFTPDLVQLPLSLFDQRLLNSGHLDLLKARNVEIHVRSVYLQGLAFMDPTRLDPFFDKIKPRLKSFRDAIDRAGCSVVEACLQFVLSQSSVDRIVIGVCSVSELEQLLIATAAETPKLDYSSFDIDDARYVNPANWRLSR